MSRVLLIKFGAIGDVVMLIPAADALRRAGWTVDWLCGPAVAPVLACYPWINLIVGDDRALLTGGRRANLQALIAIWKALAGKQYDLCATLYYDPRYKLLALPVRARRRLMLSEAHRGIRLLPGRHHTDEYARILLRRQDDFRPIALSPVRPERMPPSPLPQPGGKKRVVLAPAGARNMLRDDALRRWPPESYIDVAADLLRREIHVVLIGGPDDLWIAPAFAHLPVQNLIGTLSLTETLGLLDASDVLITHDTGPLHLAGITSVGIVSIFGPTDPRGRLPQRSNTVALWGGEGFACRPCYDGRNYAPCRENGCVRQVSPAMVIEQVLQILKQRAGKPAPPRILNPESTVVA